MPTQTVAIVNAGGWGDLSAEKGSYDEFAGLVQGILERAERRGFDGAVYKAAEPHVVRNIQEALVKLGGHGVLVFLTRGMLGEARRIKQQYTEIRVIVFTGLIPADDVIVVSKGWVLTSEQLERVILD